MVQPDQYTIPGLRIYVLDNNERNVMADIADGVPADHSLLDDSVQTELLLRAQELPRALRETLNRFRTGERDVAGLLLTGLPFSEDALGPTPLDWHECFRRAKNGQARVAETIMMIIGSLVGHVFAFGTQHGSNAVVDAFPIKGHEDEQLGSSSRTELEWHNEDAFHPYRADHIALFCLRNEQCVATHFCSAQSLNVPRTDWQVLSANRFRICPDKSHTRRFSTTQTPEPTFVGSSTTSIEYDADLSSAFERMEGLIQNPPLVSVLSGRPTMPFIRIDPEFMDVGTDAGAREALIRLRLAIDANLKDIVLKPAEMLLIDNRRAVHGRQSFAARYDGTDRWLKRINITSDLRRSASLHSIHDRRVLL